MNTNSAAEFGNKVQSCGILLLLFFITPCTAAHKHKTCGPSRAAFRAAVSARFYARLSRLHCLNSCCVFDVSDELNDNDEVYLVSSRFFATGCHFCAGLDRSGRPISSNVCQAVHQNTRAVWLRPWSLCGGRKGRRSPSTRREVPSNFSVVVAVALTLNANRNLKP